MIDTVQNKAKVIDSVEKRTKVIDSLESNAEVKYTAQRKAKVIDTVQNKAKIIDIVERKSAVILNSVRIHQKKFLKIKFSSFYNYSSISKGMKLVQRTRRRKLARVADLKIHIAPSRCSL